MWQIWLIVAGVFFIGEILTAGFLIFWLGVAALLTMCVSFFTSNLMIQMAVFVISSVILILATKPFVKKFVDHKSTPTNAYSLIGKKAKVIQEINPIENKGQIKVSAEVWTATNEKGEIIPEGTEVEILKIEGVKAIVTPSKISSKI